MADRMGVIDISQLNTPPEKHELATARYFACMGKYVFFLKSSNIPEVYRPDILMDGVEWEIKCPKGNGKKTIERNFHKVAMQSKFIIFDLRRIQLPEQKCLAQLEREYTERKYIRRLLIIKKNGELIDFSRK